MDETEQQVNNVVMDMRNTGRVRAGAVGAAAVALMVAVAGCGGSGGPGGPGAGNPPVAPAAAVDPAAEKAAVCASVEEAAREMMKGMLTGLVDAAGPDMEAATAGMNKSLADFGGRLRTESAKVADPALRGVLERSAAASEKAAASPDPVEMESADFATMTDELSDLCEEDSSTAPAGSVAEAATSIGADGTACDLPVTFGLAPLWEPQAVDVTETEEFGDLFRMGPFTTVCEIDAKPAGNIGFLRVYTAARTKDTPRKSLEKFVAGEFPPDRGTDDLEVRDATYTDIEVGGEAGTEVRYQRYDTSSKESRSASAFAVNTPRGAVVIHLGGLDSEEHDEMLPAYELAKSTLTVDS